MAPGHVIELDYGTGFDPHCFPDLHRDNNAALAIDPIVLSIKCFPVGSLKRRGRPLVF